MRRGAGDEDFDDFAYAAWPRLRWSAYLLTGDSHLAEDLAQTALAKTGDVAQVIAYGEEGEVLESHEIKPCDDPVDCEVR